MRIDLNDIVGGAILTVDSNYQSVNVSAKVDDSIFDLRTGLRNKIIEPSAALR